MKTYEELTPGDHRHRGCDGGGFSDDTVRWGAGQGWLVSEIQREYGYDVAMI